LGTNPSLEKVYMALFPKDAKFEKRTKFHLACKRKYNAWIEANGEPEVVQVPSELKIDLDDQQWRPRRRIKI